MLLLDVHRMPFRKSVSYGVIQFMIGEAMKQDGFTWWVARLRESFQDIRYGTYRTYFIGFASFWEIPAGEETAVNGYRVEYQVMNYLIPSNVNLVI